MSSFLENIKAETIFTQKNPSFSLEQLMALISGWSLLTNQLSYL